MGAFLGGADYELVGLEGRIEGTLLEGVTYFVNGTWQNQTNETTNEHDDRLPSWLFSGGLRAMAGPLEGSLSVSYAAEFSDDFGVADGTAMDIGDYWLLDAHVAWVIGETGPFSHRLYGGVRNIFDERYETYPGWKDPGLSVYVGYAATY